MQYRSFILLRRPALMTVAPLALFLLLGGCGGGGNGGRAVQQDPDGAPAQGFPAPHSQCSLNEAKREVLDLFEDYYFFNTEPAQQAKYDAIRANLSSYSSVDALLDDLRFQSGLYDRGFSYYSTREEVEQFFSAGEFFGFGFSRTVWRVIDVYRRSPADLAGIVRGDLIISVNGTPTSELNPSAASTFGPSEPGVSRTLGIRSLDGSEREVTLTKTTVDLDPVPQDRVQVFEVGGRRVGYLFFRAFIEDADDALRSAFATLAAEAIDDLVVDLRYNGGGLVDTAEVLGSLVAGPAREGLVFFEYQYNAWVERNFGGPDDIRQFHFEANGIPGLDSIYYLTGPGSASASELVISGLSPYLSRSVTVGATTFGKPVGQWGLDYCNDSMVLFLVTFRTVNSLGEGDYYAGIPVDCPATDDWSHLLGDPEEDRLAEALMHIETGGASCLAVASAAAEREGIALPAEGAVQPSPSGSLAERFIGAQ